MKSKPRTATEKAFHEEVARFARETDWLGATYGPEYAGADFHLDHWMGAQAKRKVDLVSKKVGEFAVLPVPIRLHDVNDNHPLNITNHKRAHEEIFGKSKDLWRRMIVNMISSGYELDISANMIGAISRG